MYVNKEIRRAWKFSMISNKYAGYKNNVVSMFIYPLNNHN